MLDDFMIAFLYLRRKKSVKRWKSFNTQMFLEIANLQLRVQDSPAVLRTHTLIGVPHSTQHTAPSRVQQGPFPYSSGGLLHAQHFAPEERQILVSQIISQSVTVAICNLQFAIMQ
jgi:hypothetical protein